METVGYGLLIAGLALLAWYVGAKIVGDKRDARMTTEIEKKDTDK